MPWVKIGAEIDQFLPYFFARFYRCRRARIGFGDDLGIFSELEGGGNQIERRDESILFGGRTSYLGDSQMSAKAIYTIREKGTDFYFFSECAGDSVIRLRRQTFCTV